MATETIKVLLDTDIGSDIDDAVALAYLLSRRDCELLGVTTVSGEAARRAEMASAMCRHAARDDIPVHAGADRPLLIEPLQPHAAQAAALGDRPRRRDFPPATAVEFLRQTIRAYPGEVTLLSIGPLTNLGLLFATDPEIPALLKQLVLMGGCFFGPWAEWNLRCDPHAAAIVYGQGGQARPPRHVSFGLDVTRRCTLDAADCRRRLHRGGPPAGAGFRRGLVYASPGDHLPRSPGGRLHLRERTVRLQVRRVQVSTTAPTSGMSVFQESAEAPPHTVAAEVDPKRFFEHYFDVVR